VASIPPISTSSPGELAATPATAATATTTWNKLQAVWGKRLIKILGSLILISGLALHREQSALIKTYATHCGVPKYQSAAILQGNYQQRRPRVSPRQAFHRVAWDALWSLDSQRFVRISTAIHAGTRHQRLISSGYIDDDALVVHSGSVLKLSGAHGVETV